MPEIGAYIGNFDVSEEGLKVIEEALPGIVYDEYDKLIQLCDCLASAEGVVDVEERMEDVRHRYGSYPQEKWDANVALCSILEKKSEWIFIRWLDEMLF